MIGENTFQPKIGFKTRYGMVSNPFVGSTPSDGLASVEQTNTTENRYKQHSVIGLYVSLKRSLRRPFFGTKYKVINTHTHRRILWQIKENQGTKSVLDLLTLAEGVLINNIENERQPIYMWNENHPESKKDLPLRTYTAQDVINTAKQFNDFVNEK